MIILSFPLESACEVSMSDQLGGAVIPVASAAAQKARILCLHGYAQNSDFFRSRTGALRKGLRSVAEFYFIDAPWPAVCNHTCSPPLRVFLLALKTCTRLVTDGRIFG